MFLQTVDLMTLCQLSGESAHLSGRDVSLLMLTCKTLHSVTAALVKSLSVNEMHSALVKNIRLISPWSEMYVTDRSCYFIRRLADCTAITFVVRKCMDRRTLTVVCSDPAYTVTVRPSVFKDPELMAERLLAVNRFSAALLMAFRRSYGEIQAIGNSFFCIRRNENLTQISFVVTKSIDVGSVTIDCRRVGHPYVTVVRPTVSRVLMAPAFTGSLTYTNSSTANSFQTLFSLRHVLHIHGLPRNIENWYLDAAVQTD